MFFEKIFYAIANKINHLSILFIYLFNINIKCVDSNYDSAETIFKPSLDVESDGVIPKIIWFYWHDEKLPFFIEKCFLNAKKNNPDYSVKLLNKNNIKNFINIDLSLIERESIQHQSDYIRLSLLKKYGGVWMDSSIMMFKNINYYCDLMILKKTNFLSFYCPDYILDKDNPIFENWFMISSKNNLIVCDWLDELDYCFRLGSGVYVNKVIADNKEYIQNIPNPFYFFSYIAAQKSIRKNSGYIFINAYHTAFYYHIVGGWNILSKFKNKMHYSKLIKNLTVYKHPDCLPIFIKLTGGDRDFINSRLKFKIFSKDSIIHDFLKINR
ncbi:hypothetical protein C9E88_002475 [Acinetobacter cumulans]|uniref:capsular polysaccharide synthesis protein n=1 Tax=Acinetobacter cumulans TaxID=2136182 RepID=UPI000D11EB14|nr:capsular polysaccharide synthesis protein [Acinetobacter cumulans]QCO20466.1 hypothetical protein C9E88_002475 [Acinetobacter cumulans]